MLRNVFLFKLTHAEEGQLVDVNSQLKHHNMALNGVACNDKTSLNNEMREGEEMNGKWSK